METIIVTGATRGLGLSIVDGLLNQNYKVVGIGRKISSDLSEKLNKNPNANNFNFYAFDFNNTEKIKELSKKILKECGIPFGLINNAALGHDGVLGTMHESQINELLRVNLLAPILFTKYISRSMLIKNNGRIINISSIIGSTGFNGLSVYGATKAGLNGFTKSLSRELGKANITVNSIAPGYMETDMTKGLSDDKLSSILRRSPMNSLASLEDVTSSIIFLLGQDAKSITGSVVTVDAGSTA